MDNLLQPVKSGSNKYSKWIDKLQASLCHFVISAFVLSVSYVVIVFFWYPDVHFFSNGGWSGSRIAVSVDMILGPLLTFVIFCRLKPRNKLYFDFIVIGLVQLLALGFGLHLIYQERPIALAYSDHKLMPIFSGQLNSLLSNPLFHDRLIFSEDKFHKINGQALPIVYLPLKSEMSKLEYDLSLDIYLKTSLLDEYHVHLYRSWLDNLKHVTTAPQIELLLAQDSQLHEQLQHFLTKERRVQADFYYLPMIGKTKNKLSIVDKQGNIVAWLDAQFPEKLDF